MRAPFVYILVLVAVGSPGLLKFGTAATSDVGLLNLSSVTRIAFYVLAGYALVLFYLAERLRGHSRPANSFAGLRLVVAIYGYFLLTTVASVSGTPLLLAVYRICEWFLLVVAIFAATPSTVYASRATAEDHVTKILMLALSLPPIIVLIGLIVVPDMAVEPAEPFGRLGGWIYGPNGFGATCGMGCVLFWTLSRSWLGKAWSVVLLGCLFLSYSRGAYIGFLASVIIGLALQRTPRMRAHRWALVALCGALVFLVYDGRALLEFLSRGQSVSQLLTLNSRTFIWEAAVKTLADNWLWGKGFVVGPRELGPHLYEWVQPSTAHNEILNAMVAGGVLAGGLVLALYVVLARDVLLAPFGEPHRQAYAMVAVQAVVYSTITPLLSATVGVVSAAVLILVRHAARLRECTAVDPVPARPPGFGGQVSAGSPGSEATPGRYP